MMLSNDVQLSQAIGGSMNPMPVSSLARLIEVVQDETESEAEAVALISDLFDSGRVRLGGASSGRLVRVTL